MKSIRHGAGVSKVYPIIAQQIDEITAITKESTASLVSRLVSVEYDRLIVRALEKQHEQLQKAYDELYAHHCDVINQL